RAAEGGDVVIVAGGIGLPPLRPAIYHVLAHRASYGRLVLLYGARTPADLLFTGELDAWRSRPGVMMRFAVRAVLAAGVTGDRVFLSMERDMQCAAALCGHCQLGPFLLCRD